MLDIAQIESRSEVAAAGPAIEVVGKPRAFLTSKEARILSVLTTTPRVIDEIADDAGFSSASTRGVAKRLVERGIVSVHADGRYAVVKAGLVVPDVDPRRNGDIHYTTRGCDVSILLGDAEDRQRGIEPGSIDVSVASSPYFHERDYWSRGQIGWEPEPEAFSARLIDTFEQTARALSPYALFFWVFDDYVHKGEMARIPARVEVNLERIGLAKHREIIWYKTNPSPNGTDNALAHVYEKIFVYRRAGARHYWDAYAARQEAKTGGMKRMDDVWHIPVAGHSHPGIKSHNAVFPAEVVRRCLTVAASEKGYCPECQAPWRRVLERGESTWKAVKATHRRNKDKFGRRGRVDYNGAIDETGRDVTKKMADMKHLGWEPSCEHNVPPRKARVLDQFVGSGTTGLVAVERGFDFIGIDVCAKNVSSAAKLIASNRVVE